tara:strand:+ start:808 stop:1311 length:504 start_codon:yes stop_codon:yes gene_type:complete
MDNIDFEMLLDKHISVFEQTIGGDYENLLFQKNFYYAQDLSKAKFIHGVQYSTVSVSLDEDERIKSITTQFREIIDSNFIKKIISKYGDPKNVLIIKNKQSESETLLKNENGIITQRLIKSNYDLVEGNLNEKPVYIIWNNKNIELKLFFRYEQNISELTFKKHNGI